MVGGWRKVESNSSFAGMGMTCFDCKSPFPNLSDGFFKVEIGEDKGSIRKGEVDGRWTRASNMNVTIQALCMTCAEKRGLQW